MHLNGGEEKWNSESLQKKNMIVEFSHQERRMLETLQSVILLKRDSKKKSRRQAGREGANGAHFERAHYVRPPVS